MCEVRCDQVGKKPAKLVILYSSAACRLQPRRSYLFRNLRLLALLINQRLMSIVDTERVRRGFPDLIDADASLSAALRRHVGNSSLRR